MRSACGVVLVVVLSTGGCGKGPPEATAPGEHAAAEKLTADATSGEVVARYQGRQLTADEVRTIATAIETAAAAALVDRFAAPRLG